jgi:hypothetical protein
MVTTNKNIPMEMAESATLKAGHHPTLIKSTTPPSITLSNRLPKAPPTISPRDNLSDID